MSLFSREQCLQRLRAQVAAGRPIIGGGAGTGLSAKCAEAGGIDLIILYNSGRFRMAGRGSLSGMMPYGDANAIVMEMAREVIPVVKQTPVLGGFVQGSLGWRANFVLVTLFAVVTLALALRALPETIAPARQSRWATGFRLILAIPAFLIQAALDAVLNVVAILGWFASLFTGRMPRGLRNLGAFCLRYAAQTSAYSFLLLTDRYPYAGPPAGGPREASETPVPGPVIAEPLF